MTTEKRARESKKFLGACGYTLAVFGVFTLAGVWKSPIPPEGYVVLLAGLPAVWTGQVVGQAVQDREAARGGPGRGGA